MGVGVGGGEIWKNSKVCLFFSAASLTLALDGTIVYLVGSQCFILLQEICISTNYYKCHRIYYVHFDLVTF